MREFRVSFSSFEDLVEFVDIATVQPFRVIAGNDTQWVNAKSLIGMVALNPEIPMRVRMDCTKEQWGSFREASGKFLAN